MTLQTVPARHGKAVRLARGQRLRIVNTHGHQVVDTWAFNAEDLREYLSMEHLRVRLSRISIRVGDPLDSNRRRPILTLLEDSSPGVHDTLIAACDPRRYADLGCDPSHRSCCQNLGEALAELGLEPPLCPPPLNLWMNVPVGPTGEIQWLAPVARPGDHVLLRADLDCIVVMSACPQDQLPVNGMNPVEVQFEVLG